MTSSSGEEEIIQKLYKHFEKVVMDCKNVECGDGDLCDLFRLSFTSYVLNKSLSLIFGDAMTTSDAQRLRMCKLLISKINIELESQNYSWDSHTKKEEYEVFEQGRYTGHIYDYGLTDINRQLIEECGFFYTFFNGFKLRTESSFPGGRILVWMTTNDRVRKLEIIMKDDEYCNYDTNIEQMVIFSRELERFEKVWVGGCDDVLVNAQLRIKEIIKVITLNTAYTNRYGLYEISYAAYVMGSVFFELQYRVESGCNYCEPNALEAFANKYSGVPSYNKMENLVNFANTFLSGIYYKYPKREVAEEEALFEEGCKDADYFGIPRTDYETVLRGSFKRSFKDGDISVEIPLGVDGKTSLVIRSISKIGKKISRFPEYPGIHKYKVLYVTIHHIVDAMSDE
jgi:hypothetical protein